MEKITWRKRTPRTVARELGERQMKIYPQISRWALARGLLNLTQVLFGG